MNTINIIISSLYHHFNTISTLFEHNILNLNPISTQYLPISLFFRTAPPLDSLERISKFLNVVPLSAI